MLLNMTVFQVSALTARGHASDTTQDRITLQNDILMSPDLASDPIAVLVYGQFESRGGAGHLRSCLSPSPLALRCQAQPCLFQSAAIATDNVVPSPLA